MIKTILLAGASALAVGATSANATATVFSTAGDYTWTAPSKGVYEVDVWGAQGGAASNIAPGYVVTETGGAGAGVFADITLHKGQALYLFVGQQGQDAQANGFSVGGGGGGASAALLNQFTPFAGGLVAGGGGGAGGYGGGQAGQAPAPLGPGGAGQGSFFNGQAGIAGFPGGYGSESAPGGGLGTAGAGIYSGKGFYYGGAGGSLYANIGNGLQTGGRGGSGFAGGGASYVGGGGGGGISGGGGGGLNSGGGYSYIQGAGGGGGGSYVFYRNGGSLAGGEYGDGLVSINQLTSTVPEPGDWMLLLTGVAGVGYLLRRERARRARVGLA
jgi:hypothetical protein